MIHNEKEYEEALAEMESIWEALPDTPEGRRLDELLDEIEEWEEIHYPIGEPTPEELRKFRQEQEMLDDEDGA